MKEHALTYAQMGWKIFPIAHPIFDEDEVRCSCGKENCPSIGKHPIFAGDWRKYATSDMDIVDKWWTQNPDANIAMKAEGLVILDVDDISALIELPDFDTVCSETGGGGYHYFFRTEKEYSNSPGNLPHGIDVRGCNGYVVLPPSKHYSGRNYEWEISSNPLDEGIEIQPLPKWLDLIISANGDRALDGDTEEVHIEEITLDDDYLEERLNTLPPTIRQLAKRTPIESDDRSSKEQSLITAMLSSGWTDSEIYAAFVVLPYTEKFREKGRNSEAYLSRSILNAKRYLGKQQAQESTDLAYMAGYLDGWRDSIDAEALGDMGINIGPVESDVATALLTAYDIGQKRDGTLVVPCTINGEKINVVYLKDDKVSFEVMANPAVFSSAPEKEIEGEIIIVRRFDMAIMFSRITSKTVLAFYPKRGTESGKVKELLTKVKSSIIVGDSSDLHLLRKLGAYTKVSREVVLPSASLMKTYMKENVMLFRKLYLE